MRNHLWVGLIMFAVLIAGCQHNSGKVYKLGVITNLVGRNVNNDGLNAVNMAWDDFHRQHPHSFKLEIFSADDSWDATKCLQAYRQLQSRCDIVFFQTTSNAFMAAYPDVLQNSSKLHLVVGPATTEISGKKDNVLRNNPDTQLEQRSIADYLNQHKVQRLLVIRENERIPNYTESAIQHFRSAYTGKIIETTFSADHLDLTDVMRIFRQGGFDEVYLLTGGTPAEAGVVVQTIHRESPEMPIITTPWIRSELFVEAVGSYFQNVTVPDFSLLTGKNEKYADFNRRFLEKYHNVPGSSACYCYDLATACFEAIDRTGSADANRLLKAIISRDHEGVVGTFRFSDTGDINSGLHFYRLNGSGYELVE